MILKHRILDVVFFGMLLFLASCADSINNLSTEIFSIDGFSSSSLSRQGLAILPTVEGDASKSDAHTISGLLNGMIAKKIPAKSLVNSETIEQKIRDDKTMATLWNQMEPHISAHSVKGLEATHSAGRILGVRYLLETQIQMAEEAGGAEQVRIFARIYDVARGRIIWEGVGEGRGYVKLFFPSAPATFKDTATVAVRGVVSGIFSD